MSVSTLVLAAGLSLLASPGAAQVSDTDDAQRRTGEAVNLSVGGAPQLTVFDVVRASVRDGVVTLTGKVTDHSKRDALRRRLEEVEGVRDVQDLVIVLPASKTDDDLRERIARAIYGHARFWGYAMMPSPPIRIIVEHGSVTLVGVVRNAGDRTLARVLAMQSGAPSVGDELEIR